ncbi:MAG: ubiquinol-cytochrome C chaperone family protein [Mesorhizobium sp.]|nr:ubiquinol-cytochrome C chaperone family protein [Mesorhizobium sp.]
MFKHLFGTARKRNRAIAEALYEQIMAAARQPVPYSAWNVPDTPLGRYEMLSLHVFLVLHRLKGEGVAADALAQELTDAFFQDIDHSLRELGIGDMGVPKRMKRLARMFYGRAASYDAAIDAGDLEALAAALARNVRPDAAAWPEAAALASHVMAQHAALRLQPLGTLLAGAVELPRAPGPA